MKAPQIFSAGIVLLLVGCHYMPRETNAPSTMPCPRPNIDTSRWKVLAVDDCGIRLKLPRSYGNREGGGVNEWVNYTYRSGEFNSVQISFHAEKNANISDLRVLRPSDAEGFEDCTEMINGHSAILQSFRGGGSIVSEHEFRTFAVHASLETADGVVSIDSQTIDPKAQAEILAAIRTIEFLPRTPVKPQTQQSAFNAVVQIALSFWIPLSGYLLVLIGGAYLVFRRKARASSIQRSKRRLSLAAYFALILTPSVLTDLFLFAVPAPALVGFIALLPGLFFAEQWSSTAYAVCILYVVPMLVSFGIIYGLLTLYARFRARRAASPSKPS